MQSEDSHTISEEGRSWASGITGLTDSRGISIITFFLARLLSVNLVCLLESPLGLPFTKTLSFSVWSLQLLLWNVCLSSPSLSLWFSVFQGKSFKVQSRSGVHLDQRSRGDCSFDISTPITQTVSGRNCFRKRRGAACRRRPELGQHWADKRVVCLWESARRFSFIAVNVWSCIQNDHSWQIRGIIFFLWETKCH